MSVPTGWLADPLGSGSPNVQAALPVPALGVYAEPPGVVASFDALPGAVPTSGLVNGAGSVAGRTDALRAALVRVRRDSVYGVTLLDAATMPTLGALLPGEPPRPTTPPVDGEGPRPVTPLAPDEARPVSPLAACGVRPASTPSACGVRP